MKLLLRFFFILFGLVCQLTVTAAIFLRSQYPDATSDKSSWRDLSAWVSELSQTLAAKISGKTTDPQHVASPLSQVLNKPLPQPPSPEVVEQTDAWYRAVLARHSEMALPERQLSETENGLMQWLNFAERVPANYRHLGLTKELELSVLDPTLYQPALAQKWAETNRAWLDSILTLGTYPDQSIRAVAIQRRQLTAQQSDFVQRCASALLLKARVAADLNDANAALACVRGATGLASHFDRTEAPSFAEYALGGAIRQKAEHCAIFQILPQLSRHGTVDFTRWHEVLTSPANRPTDISRCYVGEWQVTLRHRYLPAFVLGRSVVPALPFDEIVDDYTRTMSHHVTQAEASADWASWWSKLNQTEPAAPGLAASQLEFNDLIASALATHHKNVLSGVLSHAQHIAAITQLQRELVPGASDQALGADPLTGKPWQWDAKTRTLSTTSDPLLQPFAVRPLKLP